MKKYSPALLSALLISALMMFSPLTQADEEEQQVDNAQPQSYGDKVAGKALSGFTNFNTAILEIPKSIINTTNESNVVYGFIGGTVKGILNTMGRAMTGFADLITAPIPTKPIVQPDPIWRDFDAETTYDKAFRLDNKPEFVEAVSVEEAPKSINCPAAIERSTNCADANSEINARFNRMFKKEVLK